MDNLVRVIKISVKDQGRGHQEHDQQEGPPTGEKAQDHGYTACQFKEDGPIKEKSDKGHAVFNHILSGPFEIADLPSPRFDEDQD